MKIVVAGDRATVEPQLRELGLGAPLVVDVHGDPVAAPAGR